MQKRWFFEMNDLIFQVWGALPERTAMTA